MKIAKKIFFIIAIICVVLFTTYIAYHAAADCTGECGVEHKWDEGSGRYYNFTDSTKFQTSLTNSSWKLGNYLGLGLAKIQGIRAEYEGNDVWINVHTGTFLENFLVRTNKDFYCIEPGQDLSSGRYQYVARVDITENNAVLSRYGVTGEIQGNNTGVARESSRELVEILKRAKEAATTNATYTDRDGEHGNVGTEYLRERGESKGKETFSYKYDVYQRVLWKHLDPWRNTVFGNEKLPEIGTGDNSYVDPDRNDADLLYASEYEATQIKKDVYATVNDQSIRETGVIITDKSSDDIKNKELSTKQKYGDYTILGPFKYDYRGNIKINVYFNNNKSNSATGTSIGKWNGSTFTEVSTIPDNSDFYVKVPTSYLTASINTLNIDVEVSSTEEKTTLYILESVDKTYQHQMYVNQTSTPINGKGQFSYKLETTKTVTLEKKSTDGQVSPNVKFKLYNENGTYINTYTTGTNGTINIPNIEIGKNYILEETSNKTYGGRGANIANATISAGGTITNIDKANRKITFKLTDNATLKITNTIDLGKITIRKIDNTSGKEIKLKGVEFELWDMTVDWVSLYDKNTGKFIEKIDGTNEINILDYVIKGTKEDTLRTRFVTNSNGEIVIKNLQIYHSATQKNHFLVSEVANNNYGYKGMILESGNIVMSNDNTKIIKEGNVEIQNGSLVKFDNTASCIRQVDKSVKFSIDQNAILTIKNIPKLGDLTIIKEGEDAKPLPNVKFAVWQESKGFIRLTDTELKKEIVSENDIDMSKYKITYTSNVNEATKFVTNSEGKVNITNLEVYSGVDSQGNPISNVYTIREVENENYGYSNMTLGKNTVTINAKPIGANNLSSSIDEEKREIKFTMQGDTEMNIKNTPELSNLTIEKVGGDGKTKQQDVEFVIWQLSGGYVRLFEEQENGLKFVETIKSKVGEPIDFKNYVIGYSESVTGEIVPTRFITNEIGQIQIINIETYNKYKIDQNNCHFVSEVKNDNYGYKARIIEAATIIDGRFSNFDGTESYIRQSDSAVKFILGENTILTIKNKPQLANVLIKKENTDGEVLPNVEFELWQYFKGGYVRLFEEKENRLEFVEKIKSENGKPIDFENYVIENVLEVTEDTLPTRFITNESGQLQINNLETHYNSKLEYYVISETKNDNYGYKGMTIENAIIEGGTLSNFDNTQSYIRQRDRAVKFMITKNATLTIKNKPQLGNMLIHKQSTNGSVLKDVEFIISRGENEYIVLKDSKGNNLNPNKINEEAIIDLDGSFGKNEYSITYSNDKEEATVFITGEEGTINIKNLEVYQPYKISRSNTGVVNTQPTLYEYTLHEVANPNYGYVLMNTENLKLNLIAGETKEEKLYNKQIYTKLSGYVWIEKKDYSKDNAYDLLYNESTADIKLTDLYITNGDGKLKRNLNAMVPVKILLRNTTTKEIREPDEYIYQGEKDKNINDAGKYTFIDVEIEKLSEYEIVFEYDGFYYSTIIPKIEANNGSKVKENEEDRTLLNQKFGTVESGDKIVSKNGKTEKVIYGEVENCNSELLGFETANLTKVQAKTIVGISEMFNDAQGGIVDNINMGLLERDQPILWIDNNISNVKVNLNVNGEENTYTYNYKDGERVFLNEEYYYEKIDGVYKPVKVNKEDEGTILLKDELEEGIKTSSIPQTIVKSDLSAAIKDQNDGIEMGVSMIYKISVNNSSGKLTSVVHKIKNYFDSRYIIEEIGLSINNNVIGDIIYKANPEGHFEGELVDITLKENVGFTYDAGITPVENLKYNSVIIPLGKDGIRLKSLESRNIYIKYRLNDTALEDLINGETYYNNAAEIIKYSTYYEDSVGTGLVKDENNKITKMDISTENIKEDEETRRTGEIYAGITLGNRPDNIELKLIKHEDVLKFDDSKYEIDSKEAQTLILDAEGVRTISGNIFEDSASRTGDNQWIADGKFDKNSESGISNVKVELYNVGNNGAIGSKATYANNEPVVAEAIDGKYKLGGYTDGAGNVYGILPGKYIIQYTYGSYDDKQTFINDEDNTIIDVMEYKSTIISEDNPLKTEFKNNVDKTEINKSWFLLQGENYSAAIDNLRLRAEYLAPIEENTVNYGKLRGSGMKILKEDGTIDYQDGEIDMMTAQTLPMNVNIHFTAEDNAEVIKKDENGQIKHENPSTELENVNFGIVERPKIDIKINKEITEIEVIAQNGASVIPKGNPRKSKMSYIAAPQNEKSITAQIDPKLLQGATLNLEYTVTVENNSNIDYICEEYYYFGEKKEEFKNTPNAKLVVDYLDATMELDETKTENAIWKKESADLLKSGEYINSDVHTALTKNGENKTYYAYTTSAFEEVNIGEEPKSEKMYISKKLSISEDIKETNRVEIIEISGRRAITGAVPGNYNPSELVGTSGDLGYMSESDWSKDEVNFMPPTGTIVDYGMYTIAAVVMFTILTIGIIVIKKKVII